MAEWVTLLLLVPVIVVPAVLLFGFSGCNLIFGIKETILQGPTLDVVDARSGTIVQLAWHGNSVAEHYAILRINQDNPNDPDPNNNNPFSVTGFAFKDSGLIPKTNYTYQVASRNSGEDQSFSLPPVPVQTLSFQRVFTGNVGGDAGDWEGYCLVMRIEPAELLANGAQVIITLLGSSATSASIDRIYISEGVTTGQLYDSATTPTKVYDVTSAGTPRTIGKSEVVPLDPVSYPLDRTKPLLVAFDFTGPTPVSRVSIATPMPGVTAFFKAST